ncbi:MAG: glycosyltransferase family 39 protein, partial [Pseudomonadales bacterium]
MSKKKSAQHKQPPAANPQRLSLLLRERWHLALPTAALLLMSIISYWPAYFAGFVWDDKVFLDAPPIVAMSGLADIWFTPGSLEFEGHYWPLVYTTFWLEHKLWGFNPTAFHIINVLLHGAVTLLIWRLLARLSVPGAWLAAAIFAVHPVHVEAVAWVIARKDLLAALFYLLAAGCWLRFKNEPKTGAYLLMLALFTAGMLSKSFVITLPANLLVWAWWKQGRIAGKDLM